MKSLHDCRGDNREHVGINIIAICEGEVVLFELIHPNFHRLSQHGSCIIVVHI